MAKIDDILREADLILEKNASKKQEVPQVSSDDEVTKLANLLIKSDAETFSNTPSVTKAETVKVAQEQTIMEKVASALIISEVVKNLDKFEKIAKFEEQALASGYTQAEVDKFIVEKML